MKNILFDFIVLLSPVIVFGAKIQATVNTSTLIAGEEAKITVYTTDEFVS